MTDIYGVDSEEKFDAIDVRDAIIKCFIDAHREEVGKNIRNIQGSEEEIDNVAKIHAENLVLKYFIDHKTNYDEPTKEDLIGVCDALREYALNFRDKKEVDKNYNNFMLLIDKL